MIMMCSACGSTETVEANDYSAYEGLITAIENGDREAAIEELNKILPEPEVDEVAVMEEEYGIIPSDDTITLELNADNFFEYFDICHRYSYDSFGDREDKAYLPGIRTKAEYIDYYPVFSNDFAIEFNRNGERYQFTKSGIMNMFMFLEDGPGVVDGCEISRTTGTVILYPKGSYTFEGDFNNIRTNHLNVYICAANTDGTMTRSGIDYCFDNEWFFVNQGLLEPME